MRHVSLLALFTMVASAGCSDSQPPQPSPTKHGEIERTAGETRATIAPHGGSPAIARSGPEVPVSLPKGFTLYPDARVVVNTVVERGGRQRTLLVFETGDPVVEVIALYRRQAAGAGAQLTLDVGGEKRASLGGEMAGGGTFALSARRDVRTRVELAFD